MFYDCLIIFRRFSRMYRIFSIFPTFFQFQKSLNFPNLIKYLDLQECQKFSIIPKLQGIFRGTRSFMNFPRQFIIPPFPMKLPPISLGHLVKFPFFQSRARKKMQSTEHLRYCRSFFLTIH